MESQETLNSYNKRVTIFTNPFDMLLIYSMPENNFSASQLSVTIPTFYKEAIRENGMELFEEKHRLTSTIRGKLKSYELDRIIITKKAGAYTLKESDKKLKTTLAYYATKMNDLELNLSKMFSNAHNSATLKNMRLILKQGVITKKTIPIKNAVRILTENDCAKEISDKISVNEKGYQLLETLDDVFLALDDENALIKLEKSEEEIKNAIISHLLYRPNY